MYKLVAILVVAGFLSRWIVRQIQIVHFKSKHGCKPVIKIDQSERIVGYGLYRTQINAQREKNILKLAQSRYRNYGNSWSAYMMGQLIINTIEPENIKTVLATNFKDFGLGRREEAWGALLGKGIFTTDGAHWEHSRALVRPNFSRAQVADLEEFERHIQHFLLQVPKDGSTVDLQPLFFKLTLDSSTEFLFGKSVDSLTSREGSENHQFSQAYDFAQSRLPNRARLGKLIYLLRDPEFEKACDVVHKYVDKIVSDALERVPPRSAKKSIKEADESQRYVFLTEMIQSTRDPKQLRDELLNILLAGRDTTASLLSNTFHVLARRPDIWQKVKAEVDELKGAKPDYDTLRDLKYIKNVLNESLRLYPVVPANNRFANKDTCLPTGGGPDGTSPIFIQRGTAVAWHKHSMHRRADIYGADALSFRPERWNPEETLRPGWAYLPFNGGPRICVGQIFALTHATYLIVRLVQEFEAMEDRDGSEWVEQLGLTVCSAKGVLVGMMPRR